MGKLPDLASEVPVGQLAHITGLALPDQSHLVSAIGFKVSVDTVVADVQTSAHKPACMGRLPVQHGVPGLVPVELARPSRPPSLRISLGLGKHLGVADVRLSPEVV